MKFQKVLKIKSSGEDVKWVQSKLKEFGFHKGKVDGFFGQDTLVSVTNFQRSVNIKVDGVVGRQTWIQLANYDLIKKEEHVIVESTEPLFDIPLKVSFANETGLKIYDLLLNDDEYYQTETKKDTIFLHQTAGGSRPDWSIGGWEKDFQKDDNGNPILDGSGNPISLKVGTSYVIGRRSSTGDSLWDGKVIRAFDDKYWAYHLGISRNSKNLNSRSIGIEICNYGPLKEGKDGRFYNWVNNPVNESDIVELDNPFRGFKYYERYTDAQLNSTRNLILYLEKKWGIEIERGIYNENWFNYNDMWFSNGGLRSHTQVRKDKFDIFPQKEMIQMLNSL